MSRRSCWNDPNPVGTLSLPRDLWNRFVFPYLRWRDTNSLCGVCSELRRIVSEAKRQTPEWRTTVLGPSATALASLELLQRNHLDWVETRYAPDLVLLFAASQDPKPWRGGSYWKEAMAAITEARLLPQKCKIVGMLTMKAAVRMNDELAHVVTHSTVTLSISVAQFPDTTIEMASFERKKLRRQRGDEELAKPFNDSENGTPSFLLFGVNNQSASQLVRQIEKWYPGAAIAGAVSPLNDRCEPLTYCIVDTVCLPVRKARRHVKFVSQRRRRLTQQTVRGQFVFPSTLLLCLNGAVSMKVFSASGFYPITPVIQFVCLEGTMGSVVRPYLASIIGQQHVTQQRLEDILEPSERLAMERAFCTNKLSIFSCHDSAPLRSVLACCNSNESIPSVSSSSIERLDDVIWNQGCLMSLSRLGWQEGSYGIVASTDSTRVFSAVQEALERIQARSSSPMERVFGAYIAAATLDDMEDSSLAIKLEQLCRGILGENQLGGCVVSNSVGPVAFFNSVQPFAMTNTYQVQAQITCGAVFVMNGCVTR
ncbi:hypothetical protein PsorP6_006336 [Peronosclerospora sorghi]|uniref:Uncharacterized protein n=1 Tax=Peronosclerospora sorghi TaxID=230839 RepID=A0ACC0W421_9STRA|nr:hypothetical protein PsorP6_006336 [Peronosclerospora sorghi]